MPTMHAATVNLTAMPSDDPIAARPVVKSLHKLCASFPPMTDRELQELIDDVQARGLKTPIVLLDDQVLDGRHRYHACLEAGVQARFRDFGSEPGDGDDPGAFVMSMNAKRRHLSPGQLAIAAAQVQNWSLAHPAHRVKEVGTSAPLSTVADRAAAAGVSERTQKDADLVVREAPELAEDVKAGKVSVKQAAKQVRAAKAPVGGEQQGVPTAEDYDSPWSSEDPGDDFGQQSLEAPAPSKPEKVKALPPADPRDARIAELLEANEALRDALAMSEQEVATLRAAETVEESEQEIRRLKKLLEVADSQSREWMTKCNETIRQVKALQKVIRRLEAGK